MKPVRVRAIFTLIVLFLTWQGIYSEPGNVNPQKKLKTLRVLVIGDSNTEIGNITMPLKALIDSTYGDYGTGYCTLNTNSMGRIPDGLSVQCDTNWKKSDMRDGWAPEPGPYYSPDGLCISSAVPGAAVTVWFDGDGIDLYYLQGPEGGSISVSIDDKPMGTVTHQPSTPGAAKANFNQLGRGRHVMVVRIVSGRVTLFGVDARKKNASDNQRFVMHKWGNGWASTEEYVNIEKNVFTTALQELNPDKVIVLLGTNDHGLDKRDPDAVKTNLKTILSRIKKALPDARVILVSTFTTDGNEAKVLLPEYVNTSFPEAAAETGSTYWDMNTWFGPYRPEKIQDGVHVNEEYGKIIASALLDQCTAQFVSNLRCYEYDDYVLTHQLTPTGPIPTAFDPDGVYPYVSYCETSNRPVPRKYHFIVLENDSIKVTVCPDLGGKITSMKHKKSGKEVLYVPEVIRHTRILPRFYFTAGGIEVSFPISHTPVQNEKVLYSIDRAANRIYLTCGERELRFGMQWSVEYSIGPGDNFCSERVRMHNPGSQAYPWMSWSNAAVPSAPDTRFDFPGGEVLSHSSFLDTIDWKSQGPKTESDIKEMTGWFWKTSDVNAFGVYTPSLGTGLYHVADRAIAPGIKLWSYGRGSDSTWSTLSTASGKPYVEIQGGPISDQSIKMDLKPGEYRWHAEYWIPADKQLDINSINVPDIKLRPIDSVPLFGWARNRDADIWIELLDSYKSNGKVPSAPEATSNCWPPSGMEDLDSSFQWAIKNSSGAEADLWRFYYGAWAAGRSDTTKAISILSPGRFGLSKALLARLYKLSGNCHDAELAFKSITEHWIQIHPQVVIERDRVLRCLGKQTLEEREYWLKQVDALTDEWLIERRVQLLIDQGKVSGAKELLLSTHFQKVHQSYTRTGLWFQICDILNEPRYPIPAQLGEDRLARFGAYREYE